MPRMFPSALVLGMVLCMTGAAAAQAGGVPACLHELIAARKQGINPLPVIAIYEIVLDGRQLYRIEYDHLKRQYSRAPLVVALDAECNAIFKLQIYEYNRRVQIKKILWINGDEKYLKSFAVQKKYQSEEARKWLEKSIEEYFSNDDLVMKKITTPEYYAYKSDAMDLESGSEQALALDAFENKWRGRFDTSKAGVGEGFLMPSQDWTVVKVEKCALESFGVFDDFSFDVLLRDDGFKSDYSIKIIVKRQGGQYRIADVRPGDG